MEEKKKIWKSIKFWIGVVIIIAIIGAIFLLKKPKFEVEEFTITEKITEYDSIPDSINYTGEGVIKTSDKKHTYLVVLKTTLKSGGNETSREKENQIVIVNDGQGEFYTFDYGDEGEITKPKYKFEILGSIKIK